LQKIFFVILIWPWLWV